MKGQIFVIDLLFFSLIVILIIYIFVIAIQEVKINEKKNITHTENLEQILFVEELVSNCEYFAYSPTNRNGLCYKNLVELKLTPQNLEKIKANRMCKITLEENQLINNTTEIKNSIIRGVIHEGSFKRMEFGFC